MKVFKDRHEAGVALARELEKYSGRDNVIVLALPCDGVPVAYEVAIAIGASLDVFVVRQLGSSTNDDIVFGTLASGGICILDRKAVADHRITDSQIATALEKESVEVARRDRIYRGTRRFPDLPGQVVIIVDEGVANGLIMQAAVGAARKRNPSRVVVAAPVVSPAACAMLQNIADECVCIITPQSFHEVADWYNDHSTTTDQQVSSLVRLAAERTPDLATP